jgi:glycine cleavage system aminomethyltransferase T
VLRETSQRFLLVVDAEHAVDAWQELFDVGRALGLSMVGTEALDRLAAAPRV